MQKALSILFFIFLIESISLAKLPGQAGFQIATGNPASDDGLLSNSIIDMKGSDYFNVLFLATGEGLSRFRPADSVWTSFTHDDNLGKGGVTAIDEKNGMIWLATAFDTLTSLGHFTAGGGISWTSNPDTGWAWMPQPVDSQSDTTVAEPTTTNIKNITYDIAITDSAVWTASFAGGLRKYSFSDDTWYNVPPDAQPFQAVNYNHRVFAVISAGNYLFAGTADGINRIANGSSVWTNYNHNNTNFNINTNNGISGDFVVALAYQHFVNQDSDTTDIIWAATWPNDKDNLQVHSVSKSENWGLSWTHCTGMDYQFTHNFAFDDSICYAATDEGMWKTIDFGASWYLMPDIVGENYNYAILEPKTYCGDYYDDTLWIGFIDGLASTSDYGNTWLVYRSFVSTILPGQPSTYAYPNPYSPTRRDFVRFQYHLDQPAEVKVRIYDFAMDLVVSLPEVYHSYPGDWEETWNGRNAKGDIVANAVYFYMLEIAGQGTSWGKVMILD